MPATVYGAVSNDGNALLSSIFSILSLTAYTIVVSSCLADHPDTYTHGSLDFATVISSAAGTPVTTYVPLYHAGSTPVIVTVWPISNACGILVCNVDTPVYRDASMMLYAVPL